MNILKLTLVAAALTIGSGAAFADSSRAPQPNGAHGSAMTVAMTRSIDTGVSPSASRPTIFGHAVSEPHAGLGSVQVWGHALDR